MRMFYSLHDIAMLNSKLSACSLKKVQGKKKRDAAAAEAKRLAEAPSDEAAPAAPAVDAMDESGGSADLLSSKDEDVIF